MQANGALEINVAIARIAGPLAGTYCYQQFGIEVVYVVGSILTILSGLLLLQIQLPALDGPTEPPTLPALRSIASDLKSALVYLKSAPLPQYGFGIILLMGALCYPMITLIPVVVEENLRAGVREFGHLRVGGAVGSLATGLVLLFVKLRGSNPLVLVLSAILGAAAIALFGQSTDYALSMAFIALSFFGGATNAVLTTAALQQHLPEKVRGKMFSLMELAFSLPRVGTFYMGPLVSVAGVAFTFAVAPAIAIVGILVLFLAYRRALERLPR